MAEDFQPVSIHRLQFRDRFPHPRAAVKGHGWPELHPVLSWTPATPPSMDTPC